RGADAGDERRLAGIGEPDHAHVGEQLQLESEPAPIARPSQVGLARRAIGGRREARVTAAAPGAGLDQEALTGGGEITDRLGGLAVGHDRADRNAKGQVAASGAVAIGALAVLAALGLVMTLVVIVEQRRESGIGLEPDISAVTAI